MRRPQFSLKTMLWLVVVVAAFLGGMELQRRRDKSDPGLLYAAPFAESPERIRLGDGSVWQQVWQRAED